MKIAVIGATGMVGTVMLKLLEERNFPVTELLLVASKKSVGKQLLFKNKGRGRSIHQTTTHPTSWILSAFPSFRQQKRISPWRKNCPSSNAIV